MTLAKQDDGGFWISGPLVAVLVAAIFAAFGAMYQSENNRLWEDSNDITSLKVSMSNMNNEISRTEVAVGAMNQTFTSILNSTQSSKDSVDALKEQIHELQKQVGDLDAVLRPRSVPGEH